MPQSAVPQSPSVQAAPFAAHRRSVPTPATVADAMPPAQPSVDDLLRADCYALVAALLLAPPTRALLDTLAQTAEAAQDLSAPHRQGPDRVPSNRLDASWRQLTAAASVMPLDAIASEFAALFEGTGKPLLDPYASPYLSGYMMEKPLAALRSDLAVLGLARSSRATVPEDHLGALCETMRLLIAGAPGYPHRSPAEQRAFFRRHLEPWAFACLADIEQAQPASFYRCVAVFARQLLDAERRAFALDCTN